MDLDNWITFLHDHPKYYDSLMEDLKALEDGAITTLINASGENNDVFRAQATIHFIRGLRARIANTVSTPYQPQEVTR